MSECLKNYDFNNYSLDEIDGLDIVVIRDHLLLLYKQQKAVYDFCLQDPTLVGCIAMKNALTISTFLDSHIKKLNEIIKKKKEI
jgi:hypothetical protein